MAISKAEIACRSLWSTGVRLRDKCCVACLIEGCEMCFDQEAHHLVLRAQGDWRIQYDVDFGVTLCAWHHRQSPDAPHVSRIGFEAEVLPNIIQLMEPGRAQKVRRYFGKPVQPARGSPDFAVIRKRLRGVIKELEGDYYYDGDLPA